MCKYLIMPVQMPHYACSVVATRMQLLLSPAWGSKLIQSTTLGVSLLKCNYFSFLPPSSYKLYVRTLLPFLMCIQLHNPV